MVTPRSGAPLRISAFLSLALSVCCALGLPASAQSNSADPLERLRGIELYNKQKYREATELLKQAVKKNKSDADAWYYLGLTLLQNPGTYKDSSKAFETATKLRPNFADAHTGLAYLLLIRNKNDGATREAQAAQALVTFLAADVLSAEDASSESKKDRLRQAAEALDKYLQLMPNDSNRATWTEQLENLRVHAQISKPGQQKWSPTSTFINTDPWASE